MEAAMSSVTAMRKKSHEVRRSDPQLGRLGQRQYEYLQNSLRRSLNKEENTGSDAPYRKKNIQKTDQIAPLNNW